MSSYTPDQLAALRAAYAKGVLEVRRGDETVKYATRADMLARIRHIEAELAAAGGTSPTRVHNPTFDRGL